MKVEEAQDVVDQVFAVFACNRKTRIAMEQALVTLRTFVAEKGKDSINPDTGKNG